MPADLGPEPHLTAACPQVNFNEPLSMLQRLTEDLEYHHLLDKAVHCTSSVEQMCLVAAFSVSSYSTTVHRIAKPFNPMLGETFELDRLDDMGLRSLCEQVSSTHAPLIHSSQARARGAEPVSSWGQVRGHAICPRTESGLVCRAGEAPLLARNHAAIEGYVSGAVGQFRWTRAGEVAGRGEPGQ